VAGLEASPHVPHASHLIGRPIPLSLRDFLYLCPDCGHTPVNGASDRVSCPACGIQVDREGATGTRLRVRFPDGQIHLLSGALLARRIEAHGGAFRAPGGGEATLPMRARVRLRVAGSEEPVQYRNRLLGFVERFAGGTPGELLLDAESIAFQPDPSRIEAGDGASPTHATPPRRWPLEEIQALQTSSSAIQLTTPTPPGRGGEVAAAGAGGSPKPGQGSGILLFRLEDDSPRRWDERLRYLISARRESLGLGRVVEFQPRIRSAGARP
jgi:hypothetical protein